MISRKDIRKKRSRSKLIKFLAGTLLLSVIIGSSMHVSFADQDIKSLIINWFDNKETESISEIEEAISAEQETQTERLKEVLRSKIETAEQELSDFTETEKAKRTKELQTHANKLISNMKMDNSEEESKIIAELENISQEAKDKMADVHQGEDTKGEKVKVNESDEKESANTEGDNEAQTSVEDKTEQDSDAQ